MAEKQLDDVKINVEFAEEQELKGLNSGEGLSVLMGKLAKAVKELIAHLADNVRHVTASERANWNGKANGTHGHSAAEISGLPTSLPANGGNADTVDGSHAWQMQTLSADGGPHGPNNHLIVCRHNVFGDERFAFIPVNSNPGAETRVHYASGADNAKTVGNYYPAQLLHSGQNLLDNPDFRVNQRGVTEVAWGYGVDRWVGNYTIDTNGITVRNGNLFQFFEKEWFAQFNGKVMTLSVSVNGTVYSGSSMINETAVGSDSYDTEDFITEPFNVDIYTESNGPALRFYGDILGKHVEWVKLEEGDVCTPYVPPNPTLELLKCMRYYQTSASLNGSMNLNCPVIKEAINVNRLSAVELAVPMRITPTISVFSLIDGSLGTVTEWISDTPVSNIITCYANEKTFVLGSAAATGFEIGTWYTFHYVASAEL